MAFASFVAELGGVQVLINKSRIIDTDDQARFAWAGLARYHNVSYTVNALDKLHNLRGSHRANILKQAEQIRYCLIQALEYRKAAEVVGLSTKPLLYYYSAMSLALAQNLMKGTGDVSLDRARGKNAHHGLTLKGAGSGKQGDNFSEIAGALKAVPLQNADGKRFGTFELWHELSRDLPDSGIVKRILERGFTESFEPMGIPEDKRPPLVASSGISLLDCYKCLPQLREFLIQHNVLSSIVKANISSIVNDSKETSKFSLIIQQANKIVLDEVCEKILFKQYDENNTDIHDFGGGYAISVTVSGNDSQEFILPSTIQTHSGCIYLFSKLDSLNEFGLFYVSLYILGNYARYFPDQWMRDVESYSTMALAADELLSHANSRLPLLTLSELDRCVILPR